MIFIKILLIIIAVIGVAFCGGVIGIEVERHFAKRRIDIYESKENNDHEN